MSRNLCHKSNPIPLWNLTDSQIVTNGSWQKPIRTLSDLKIVTNGAWQKTYPNSVGLENCHKWGVTKNLSEIFRTWKLSQMGRDKKPIRTLSDSKIVTNGVWQKINPNSVGLKNWHKCGFTKKPIQNFSDLKFFIMTQKLFGKFRNWHVCQV